MNLDRTSTILKKINRLYEIINDMGEASSTEQDLLLAYVTDLHEAVSDGKVKLPKKEKAIPVVPIATPVPEPIAAAPIVKTPEQTNPAPAPKPEPVEVMEPAPPSASQGGGEGLTELFATDSINELSDKLGLRPVPDLTKAMGINEKIFTVNELFGGNQDEFNKMMAALNGLGSFAEAKKVLMGSVASKYEWANPARFKKAKTFIKLVQRRYK